jgi:hypothetical protein
MREFTKHVLLALEEDDWELCHRGIRHVKSRLKIDTNDMQPANAPYKFTWWERKLVYRAIRKTQERYILTKFIEYRINPRKPNSGVYESGNEFI